MIALHLGVNSPKTAEHLSYEILGGCVTGQTIGIRKQKTFQRSCAWGERLRPAALFRCSKELLTVHDPGSRHGVGTLKHIVAFRYGQRVIENIARRDLPVDIEWRHWVIEAILARF